MLTQISIFAENRKGAMKNLLGCLADAGINIIASVTNDSGEYGAVRMLVDKPAEAMDALQAAGYVCRTTEVIGAELPDEPGALFHLTEVIDFMNVSMDYVYLSYNRKTASPVLVMRTEFLSEVESTLRSRGYHLLDSMEQ